VALAVARLPKIAKCAMRIAFFSWVLLIVACCYPACQRVSVGQVQENASLEDLLREANKAADPIHDDRKMPRGETLGSQAKVIVTARNELVARDGGLFNALNEASRRKAECAMSLAADSSARAALVQATQTFSQHQQASAKLGQQTLGYEAAHKVVMLAEARVRETQDAVKSHQLALARIDSRLRQDLPSFLNAYSQLRRLLPNERSSVNAEIIAALRGFEASSLEWADGYLVLAAALVYDGQDAEAASYLEKASARIGRPMALRQASAEQRGP